MNKVVIVDFAFGATFYVAAATLYLVDLHRRNGSAWAAAWATRSLIVAAVLHGLHILSQSLASWTCPIFSLPLALSLAGLLAIAVYLFIGRRGRLRALGAVLAPFALTFLVGSQFISLSAPEMTNRPLLAIHVTVNLIGLALFVLAGVVAASYLIHERRLKRREVGRLASKLPPLDALDTLGHRLLLVVFPLLSLGVVSGAVFAGHLAGGTGSEVARAVLAYATWSVAAVVLVLRSVAGWRGRRAAMGTLVGTALMLTVVLLYAVRPGMGGL